MSESSILWPTNGTGDGAADVTSSQWINFFEMLFLSDKTTEGVAPRYLNALAVSSTGNNNARVATGGAVVRGFLYRSTANVDLTIPSPASDTGFRIVLRADWALQTVRAAYVLNTTGVTDAPALTQVDGTTWEISLATGTITSGGVIVVTSAPTYMHYNTNVSTAMLEALAVTTAKIAAAAVTPDQLAASVAGSGLAGGAGTALSVGVDGSTIEINADALRVKALGIGTSHLAAAAVTFAKLDAGVAGDGLSGVPGAALRVNVDDGGIEIAEDNALRLKNDGVGFLKLGGGVAKKQYRYGQAASDDWDAAGGTIYDITAEDIVELTGVLSVVVATGTDETTASNTLIFGFAHTPLAEAWIIDATGEFCMVEATTSIVGPNRQVDVTVRFAANVGSDKTVKCGWRVVGAYA